jgi:tetratricopeptide (TPR) repeat protein
VKLGRTVKIGFEIDMSSHQVLSENSPQPLPESLDAEQVESAVGLIDEGNLAQAERLLADVAARAPSQYELVCVNGTQLDIKFWDLSDFLHYVMWQQKHGVERGITWIPSAYPKALYYLAFLRVKQGRYQEAIAFLDQGERLEPTNPNFRLERAQAIVRMGQFQDSLAHYRQVRELGPHTSAKHVGLALRGEGFALIELARLDEAEACFRQSLEFDPESPVAANELAYIQELRRGKKRATAEIVQTMNNPAACFRCGAPEPAVVAQYQGRVLCYCDACHRTLTKKWWEFWK